MDEELRDFKKERKKYRKYGFDLPDDMGWCNPSYYMSDDSEDDLGSDTYYDPNDLESDDFLD